MKSVLKILATGLGMGFLLFIHIVLGYALPYPYSEVNIILTAMILIIMWSESGVIVWMMFCVFLMLEPFRASPFGIQLFAGTMTALFSLWLYRYIFTNRSWYASVVLGMTAVVIYRGIYLFLIYAAHWVKMRMLYFPQGIFKSIIWEIVFTTIVTGILYILAAKFSKRLSTNRA